MGFSRSLEVGSLKAFTRSLLEHEKTLFSLTTDGKDLKWKSLKKDRDVFIEVLRLIVNTSSLSRAEFNEHVLPKIEAIIDKSEIFIRLQKKDIRISSSHNGTTPYLHILQVLEETEPFPFRTHELRILLRIFALYHDICKMIGQGLGGKIDALMAENGHKKHSHPDHALTSALVVKQITDNPEVKNAFYDLPEEFWENLVFLIQHHHLYEDLKTVSLEPKNSGTEIGHDQKDKTTLDDVINFFKQEPERKQVYLITIFYLFCQADMLPRAKADPNSPFNTYLQTNVTYQISLAKMLHEQGLILDHSFLRSMLLDWGVDELSESVNHLK